MAEVKAAKQAKEKKRPRVQRTVHWDADVDDALEAHMARAKLENFSAAANDAARYALFQEHRGDREADLVKLYQQFSFSLAEHRKKTAQDLSVLKEIMLQSNLYYFMHTHKIPVAEQSAARAQAHARLDEFMDELTLGLTKPKAAVDEKTDESKK